MRILSDYGILNHVLADQSSKSMEDESFKNDILLKKNMFQLKLRGKTQIPHFSTDLTFEELKEHHECPYDQGGYFIINGSEKVLIA
ncbi:11012_t:CDS:2 [Funneliformis mosseae]|uniref:DNA-directed RNA polymerase n=1 Tax=Funneliformis mosseae TaxID=27381 RepID=A0A9N9C5S3_FUNMO|nr:11012_t:CDS:2 [Funneliformis mosseae]